MDHACALARFAALVLVASCTSTTTYEGRSSAEWRRLLDTSDVHLRTTAAYAVVALESPASTIAEPLVRLLDDTVGDVREEAARALTTLHDHAGSAGCVLPALGQVITTPTTVSQKGLALRVLASWGAEARPASPAMFKALRDTNAATRVAVVGAIEAVYEEWSPTRSTDAASELHVVRELLTARARDDPNEHVRAAAIQAVSSILPKAPEVWALLDYAVHDASSRVREETAYALARIGAPARAIPVLLGLLSDGSSDTRAAAASALGSFGVNASSAIAALEVAARDSAANVRAHAQEALSLVGRRNP